jgi:hypothetical protein
LHIVWKITPSENSGRSAVVRASHGIGEAGFMRIANITPLILGERAVAAETKRIPTAQ